MPDSNTPTGRKTSQPAMQVLKFSPPSTEFVRIKDALEADMRRAFGIEFDILTGSDHDTI